MKFQRSRTYRKGRIEIIPMIDVMLFLLATFMLASLSMQNLHSMPVHLPQGKAAPMLSKTSVTLTVTPDSQIFLDKILVSLETLANTLKPMLGPETTIIVTADSAAPNGVVVQAMLQSRKAGAEHFQIAVKHVE